MPFQGEKRRVIGPPDPQGVALGYVVAPLRGQERRDGVPTGPQGVALGYVVAPLRGRGRQTGQSKSSCSRWARVQSRVNAYPGPSATRAVCNNPRSTGGWS